MHLLTLLLAQQALPADWKSLLENPLVWAAGGGAVLLLILVLVLRSLGKRESPAEDISLLPLVEVATLTAGGPSPGQPYLEFYSVPVRLSAIVLAPVGREGRVPNNQQMPAVMEAILPGMMKVLAAHQPQFVRWPPQLSTQGFAQAFFNNAPLPGDHGRGTPWCSVAGRVELPSGQYLIGLVCCAAGPNSLGEVTTKHAAGWPEVIRVKEQQGPPRRK